MSLSPSTWRWLAVAASLAVLVGHSWHLQPWTLDDAFITFRYAENLAAGHGPVFNPGERVEGYTTFLWMLLLSGAHAAGLATPVAAKLLGGLFAAGLIALVAALDRILPDVDTRTAALATVLVGTSPVLSRWALSGMEVALTVLLVTATLVVDMRAASRPGARGGLLAGVLAALAMMTRPDAGLAIAAVSGRRLLDVVRRKAPASELLWPLLSFLAVYGPYFAWRYSYYGWLLPNTFYVKVGATSAQLLRGLIYVNDYGEVGSVGLILAGLGVVLILLRRLPAPAGIAAPILFGLGHLAYMVAVGGDVFFGFRFFAVLVPPTALVLAVLLRGARVPRGARVGALVVLVALNLINLLFHPRLNQQGTIYAVGLEVGEFLRENAPPDALLATNIAGSIPWASRLRTIDTLGLNDLHIAHREMPHMGEGTAGHEKGDGDYVLQRAPDYVMFGSSDGQRVPKFVGDKELFRRNAFHAHYALQVHELPDGRRLRIYVRRLESGGAGLAAAPLYEGDGRHTVRLGDEVLSDEEELLED